MNPNRVLVSIRKVDAIEPLTVKNGEPARTEIVRIGGWKATATVGEFHAGDLVVFAETDSVFPVDERWSFLERCHYRIKTQKYNNLRDQYGNPVISQGLVLPLSVLPDSTLISEGQDVTKVLGVTHAPEQDEDEFEANAEFGNTKVKPKFKWLPKGLYNHLMKYQWFRTISLPKKEYKGFPKEVSKTDEERIQNCGDIVNKNTTWTATEKVDGMSSTYLLKRKGGKKFEFIVCSRNNRLTKPDGSAQWAMAKKYNIEAGLKKIITKDCDWIAIQGECAGPKIQKNPQGLSENRLFVFNLISPYRRVKSSIAKSIIEDIGLEWVPILETGLDLRGKTEADLLEMANGRSALNPDKMREGIVFRAENPDVDLSFKAVSPEYLLKKGE